VLAASMSRLVGSCMFAASWKQLDSVYSNEKRIAPESTPVHFFELL
jgi:hypothetical protein